MAKRYESLDGSEIIEFKTMEAMAASASEHDWVFAWHGDRTVTVIWDDEIAQTYVLRG